MFYLFLISIKINIPVIPLRKPQELGHLITKFAS
jgi:hypothetical protein